MSVVRPVPPVTVPSMAQLVKMMPFCPAGFWLIAHSMRLIRACPSVAKPS